MGKKLFLCSALVSCLLLLVACSSKNSELVGKWYNSEQNITFEFKADGTGVLTSGSESESFKYEVDDGQLTMTGVNSDGATGSDEVSYRFDDSNNLIFTAGDGFEYVLVKQE